MSTPIFFAHANGFPSGTYAKLLALLPSQFPVLHLEQHAHDPRFPVDDNWESLVDELLHHLQALDQPVWGIGHSLGGVLHYHAALRHPELYRGVIMLDSPVLTRLDQWAIRLAKGLGQIDRITPAGRTLGRREHFADAIEARDYFAGKTLFKRFDPDCLDAYVAHALVADGEQGLRLKFDPQTEISIYRSVPHTSPGRPRQMQRPLAVIRGRHSQVVLPHHTRAVGRMARGEAHSLAGGHMFPLERPQETAALLGQLLNRWTEEGA